MSRIPRSSFFYFVLVAVLGIVFWFTWQSLENGSKGDAWSYSQLLTKADQGQVSKVEIQSKSKMDSSKSEMKTDTKTDTKVK